MSTGKLDDRYLSWLYSQVGNVKTRIKSRTHWSLMRQLHKTIFVALVPFDENRLEDAIDLRYEFLAEAEDEQGDPDWTRSPCSMLELLIVLSRQLAFEADDKISVWFWHLVEILGLERFNDQNYNQKAEETVEKALDVVIWRTFDPDGKGGLFPLRNPKRDQRKVELWYQLNAYLLEQF